VSSSAVRTAILDFLDENSSETVIDMTGHYEDFREFLADAGVQPDAPFLLVQFIGGGEEPVSLSATNSLGLYRETGLIQLHVCAIAKIGVGASIISRGELLRDLFRGVRINGIVIDGISTTQTDAGATLDFDAGYVSGTIGLDYHCDINLTP
jgi:hypothetical protein